MDMIDVILEKKVKRFFRSKKKISTPNFISHITQRAAGREPLFVEGDDYLRMLALLKETCRSYEMTVHSFCLMPNHVHVLVRPTKENLFHFMRTLFSSYAGYFNRKYERRGHLFGGPYRQSLCLDEAYLVAASLYIHLNPVRAGIAERPEEYRWSSCRLFWAPKPPRSFVDEHLILRILAENDGEARRRYRELLLRAPAVPLRHGLEEKSAVTTFLQKLRGVAPELIAAAGLGRAVPALPDAGFLPLSEIDERISALKERRKGQRAERMAAQRFVVEQLAARGFTKEEIAVRIGVSRRTVYNALGRKGPAPHGRVKNCTKQP